MANPPSLSTILWCFLRSPLLCSLSSSSSSNKLVPLLSRGGYYNDDVILVGVALKRRHVWARAWCWISNVAGHVRMSSSMACKGRERSKILNFNVGILGHIDSGKTSLGTALPLCHTCITPNFMWTIVPFDHLTTFCTWTAVECMSLLHHVYSHNVHNKHAQLQCSYESRPEMVVLYYSLHLQPNHSAPSPPLPHLTRTLRAGRGESHSISVSSIT